MSATKLQLSDNDAAELAKACEVVDRVLHGNAESIDWFSVKKPLAALAILVIKLAVSEARKAVRVG